MFRAFPRFFYSANTEGSAAPTSEETEKTTPAASGEATQPGTPPAENGGQENKTFTQADVDRIVQERLQRDREAAQKKADEEQGKFKQLYEQEKAERAREAEERAEADKAAKIDKAISTVAGDAQHKAREAKAVAVLIDRNKLTIDGDIVKGVDAEIERIKKEYPGLFFGPGRADGGKANGVAAGASDVMTPRERLRDAYATS